MHKYKEGDLVKYSSKFLRSVGWITEVPVDGRVTSVIESPNGEDHTILRVHWSDGINSAVKAHNLLPIDQPDYT